MQSNSFFLIIDVRLLLVRGRFCFKVYIILIEIYKIIIKKRCISRTYFVLKYTSVCTHVILMNQRAVSIIGGTWSNANSYLDILHFRLSKWCKISKSISDEWTVCPFVFCNHPEFYFWTISWVKSATLCPTVILC